MTAQASLNQLANDRLLEPWVSWTDQRPPEGTFRLPTDDAAARFYQDHGFLVIDGALDPAEIDALNAETAADLPRRAR